MIGRSAEASGPFTPHPFWTFYTSHGLFLNHLTIISYFHSDCYHAGLDIGLLMARAEDHPDWRAGYASDIYDWKVDQQGPTRVYTRRLGVVESLFDNDGTHFEGRADLNCDLSVEFRSSLDERSLREHICLVWSVLRQKHVLLSTQAAIRQCGTLGTATERVFVFEQLSDVNEMVMAGKKHVAFLGDHHEFVDGRDFYQHLMNASRLIKADEALSKLFVMPYKASKDSPFIINFFLILAHQITDGITTFRWISSFIDLLNQSSAELFRLAKALAASSALDRLPPPQEALYHPIPGNLARQRWFWAIARILRHVKHSTPTGFQNPLRRVHAQPFAQAFPPKYRVLDYDRIPPLNCVTVNPILGNRSNALLKQLCRQAKISIGSGLFTLVGIVMMKFEEELHPDIRPEDRLPFVGGFPLNPRPFLAGSPTTGKEDSLMLAFSEGVVLPFLSKDLPFDARFRLLGKQAHRQLRQYQKRPRSPEEELSSGTKTPRQLLPAMYMACLERLEHYRPPELVRGYNIQGAYPATASGGQGTCAVSSVGDRTQLVAAGKYDTSQTPLLPHQEVVADFRHVSSTVRPREGEFLCGSASDAHRTYFMISIDSCAIDPAKARDFQTVIENILDDDDDVDVRSFEAKL